MTAGARCSARSRGGVGPALRCRPGLRRVCRARAAARGDRAAVAQLLAAGAAAELADHAAGAARRGDPAGRGSGGGGSRCGSGLVAPPHDGARRRAARPRADAPAVADGRDRQAAAGRRKRRCRAEAAMSLRRSILEHFVAPAGGVPPRPSGDRRRPRRLSRAATRSLRPWRGMQTARRARDAPRRRGAASDRRAVRSRAAVPRPPMRSRSAPRSAWRSSRGIAHRSSSSARGPPRLRQAPAGALRRGRRARRLVANLVARGHDARAAGRLAIVRLPADAAEAAVQARRVSAAAGAAPVVLALGGPRVAVFDECLAEQDLVVVATASGTDPALARLALAGLDGATERACVCEVPPARSARSLAAAGVTLLPSARRARAVAGGGAVVSRGRPAGPRGVAAQRGRPGDDAGARHRARAAARRADPRCRGPRHRRAQQRAARR